MKLKKIIENKAHLILVILLAFGLAIFFPSTESKFLINFDDDTLILNSPEVLQLSWENIKYIFSHTKDGLYHPLTSISWQLEHHFFGLDPFYFHLDNILLHLLCVALLFQLVKTLFQNKKIALIASLLFLIHPMHVENIAWISARKDLIVCVFFLLSLWKYSQFKLNKKRKHQVAYLLFFIMALLSKASAIVLPALFILIDWFLGERNWKAMIARQILPGLFSIAALALTIYAQKSAGFIAEAESSFNLANRFFLICYSLAYYLAKFVLPFSLAPKNFYPQLQEGLLPLIYYASPLLLGGILFLIWKVKQKKYFIFGFAFLLISLFPLLKIIPTGNDLVSNRYAYMAYFGLYALIAFLLVNSKKKGITALFLLALGAFTLQSYQYQKTYADSVAVWSKVIEIAGPNSWEKAMAYNERGQVYLKGGNQALAIQDINRALKIEPDLFRALLNRANLYELNKQLDLALADLNLAVKKYPNAVEALRIRSAVYGKMGQADKALTDLNKAIELVPERYDLYNNRGIAFSILGDFAAAEQDFNRALELNKHYYDAYLNRANLYLSLENYAAAKSDLMQVLEQESNQLQASYLLAKIHLIEGHADKADELLMPFTKDQYAAAGIGERLVKDGFYKRSIPYFNIAMGMESLREKSLYQRASAFRALGEYQNALDDLMAILEKMPNPQFFFEIGDLYEKLEDPEKACEFWKEASDRKHPQAELRLKENC